MDGGVELSVIGVEILRAIDLALEQPLGAVQPNLDIEIARRCHAAKSKGSRSFRVADPRGGSSPRDRDYLYSWNSVSGGRPGMNVITAKNRPM